MIDARMLAESTKIGGPLTGEQRRVYAGSTGYQRLYVYA